MDVVSVAVFRQHLAVAVALGSGSFVEAGLDVRVEVVRSSRHQRGLVESGAVDLAHTAVDNVAAWHGADHAWAVRRVVDLGLPHRLVVSPDIATVADLRDRRIAVDSARSGFVRLLRVVLAREVPGDGEAAVEFVEVGALQARLDALVAGEVQGCLLGAEQLEAALRTGARALFALNDHVPRYPGLVVSGVRDQEDATARYVDVLARCAARSVRPDAIDETVAAAARGLGVDEATAHRWVRGELLRCTGTVAPADEWPVLVDAWRATGRVADGQATPEGWYRPAAAPARSASSS